MMKRIAVLTSGGDAPGMNAAIGGWKYLAYATDFTVWSTETLYRSTHVRLAEF